MDDAEISGSKDQLDQNLLGYGIGSIKSKVGLESAQGTVGVMIKSGSTAGSAPEYGILMESLLGSERSDASQVSGTSHTTTVINVSDTSGYAVGDTLVIKESGGYHASPIASLVTNTSVTLLIAMGSAPADAVVIEAFQSYVSADSGHPSFTVSSYLEDAIQEQARGCKTSSMSLDNFTTGQLASFKFGYEGLDYTRALTAPSYTPSYDTSETPVIIEACIYQDGVQIAVDNITLSVENTLAFLQSTCSGKYGSRVSNRSVSGSFSPLADTTSIANFTKFDDNTEFSIFITAHNPSSTSGEFSESVSIYMPNCSITTIANGDQNGIVTESIEFKSNVSSTEEDIYISFS